MSRRVPVLTTPCKFPTNKGPARSQTWSLRISLCTRRNIKCKTWLKMTPVKWVPSSSTGERGLASHKTLTQRQRREDSDELLTDFSSKFLLIIISRKELFTEISLTLSHFPDKNAEKEGFRTVGYQLNEFEFDYFMSHTLIIYFNF